MGALENVAFGMTPENTVTATLENGSIRGEQDRCNTKPLAKPWQNEVVNVEVRSKLLLRSNFPYFAPVGSQNSKQCGFACPVAKAGIRLRPKLKMITWL